MSVEHEGATASWVPWTLVVQSMQGHGLPQPQELWPYQSLFFFFFKLLVAVDQMISLASLYL